MITCQKSFARKAVLRQWKSGTITMVVLLVSLLSCESARACCWLESLFHPFCWSPCVSPCTPAYNPCPCSTLPYVPAYSYQPMMQPHWANSGCGCGYGTPSGSPGVWQPSYPATGAVVPQPQMNFSNVSYNGNSAPNSSYTETPSASRQYSEWTSVPATGGKAALQGVIMESEGENYSGYPVNPITEELVPAPYDQSGYQPQSYREEVSPDERVAKARAFRERFASRKLSKFERKSGTHTYGGGVQYDHRRYVKAPSAAIVWQTP
ncbi:MAG: hypothetical protein KDA65_06515 [Planctomycetaceae bacterium]|nr:hypothetical protein [Planctomycetaceae bacterium]